MFIVGIVATATLAGSVYVRADDVSRHPGSLPRSQFLRSVALR
jgi:hypothetical protein